VSYSLIINHILSAMVAICCDLRKSRIHLPEMIFMTIFYVRPKGRMLYHPEPQNDVQIRVGLQLSYTWILILD
jgi:hypothetical protein